MAEDGLNGFFTNKFYGYSKCWCLGQELPTVKNNNRSDQTGR